MTKPEKGGRLEWEDRTDDPRVVLPVNLYRSQRDWLKNLPGGGAAWIREKIDAAMAREKARRAKKPRGRK